MTKKFKKFPDHDFKLDCGDDPEVRQWLKDNGIVWNLAGSDVTEEHVNKKLLVRKLGRLHFVSESTFNEILTPLFNPYKKSKNKLKQRVKELEREVDELISNVSALKLAKISANSFPQTALNKEQPLHDKQLVYAWDDVDDMPVIRFYDAENSVCFFGEGERDGCAYDCVMPCDINTLPKPLQDKLNAMREKLED